MKKTITSSFVALIIATLGIYSAVGSVGRKAYAADIANRTIIISSPLASAVIDHTFQFDLTQSVNVGSIEFEYCSNSPLVGTPCTAPTGFDASAAVLSSQAGITGFAISGVSTANRIVLSRAPAAEVPVAMQYVFTTITNPSVGNQPVYVRISMFDNVDATGVRTDSGGVVYYVNGGFTIGAYVPPYLTMCIGKSVALNCANSTGAYIDLGILAPDTTRYDTSQYSVATNDYNGYVAYVLGNTMTAGNIIIPRLIAPTTSQVGISQFGINLRDNSNPDFGNDPFGPGTGAPAANYNTPNLFMFNSGDVISSSPISTNFTRLTVSYIVNVDSNQQPGRYNTTLTYLGTAQF